MHTKPSGGPTVWNRCSWMCQDGITLNNSATSKRALRTSGTVCFTCTYAVLTPHVMDHTHWSPLLYATFYGSALPTVSLFMLVRMMSVNNMHTVRVCMYLYQPRTVPQHTHTLHYTAPHHPDSGKPVVTCRLFPWALSRSRSISSMRSSSPVVRPVPSTSVQL